MIDHIYKMLLISILILIDIYIYRNHRRINFANNTSIASIGTNRSSTSSNPVSSIVYDFLNTDSSNFNLILNYVSIYEKYENNV